MPELESLMLLKAFDVAIMDTLASYSTFTCGRLLPKMGLCSRSFPVVMQVLRVLKTAVMTWSLSSTLATSSLTKAKMS